MTHTAGGTQLARFDRALGKVEDVLNLTAALSIFFLMFFGAAQVISRKLFNLPIWGYVDLVEMSMATFAFLAISSCQRVGGHIRMEILVRRLTGRTLWIVEWIGVTFAVSIMAMLLWYGSEAFLRAFQLGDSTIDREIPIWPSKILVPIAFSVLLSRLVLQSWGYWRLILHPDAKPIAVPTLQEVQELAEKEIHDTFGDTDGSNDTEGEPAEKNGPAG